MILAGDAERKAPNAAGGSALEQLRTDIASYSLPEMGKKNLPEIR
jgi:hypothetical protein